MPHYEIMTIATMSAPSSHLAALIKKCVQDINKGGGVLRSVDNLGLRPLAFRMKAHQKYNTIGRYLRIRVQASPLLLQEIENRLRVDEEIVRWQSIKMPSFAERPPRVKKLPTKTAPPLMISDAAVEYYRRQDPTLDYWAARTLLKYGKITPEQLLAVPRHFDEQWNERAIKLAQEQAQQQFSELNSTGVEQRIKIVDEEAELNRVADAERAVVAASEAERKAYIDVRLKEMTQFDQYEAIQLEERMKEDALRVLRRRAQRDGQKYTGPDPISARTSLLAKKPELAVEVENGDGTVSIVPAPTPITLTKTKTSKSSKGKSK